MNTFDQDELLAEVAKSLRDLAASNREIADGIAIARRRAPMPRTGQTTNAPNANITWLASRWPPRDGDTYGIVARQPPIQEPSPEPPVHADDPTGHL